MLPQKLRGANTGEEDIGQLGLKEGRKALMMVIIEWI